MNTCKTVLAAAAAAMAAAALHAQTTESPTWHWPGPTPPETLEYLLKNQDPFSASFQPKEQDLKKIEELLPDKPPFTPLKPRKLLVWGRLWIYPTNPLTEAALKLMAKKTGAFEATATDDPLALLPERLKGFDAVFFLGGRGVRRVFLPPWDIKNMPKEQQEAALKLEEQVKQSVLSFAAEEGKGVFGIESSLCAFGDWPDYGELMGGTRGGEYAANFVIKVEEPEHPLTAFLKDQEFSFFDQTYPPGPPYSRNYVRVLLSLDLAKSQEPLADPKMAWMKESMARQSAYTGRDPDYGLAWIKPYGKGRTICLSIGVHKQPYYNPLFLRFMLGGVQFALGDVKCETIPRDWGMSEANIDLEALEKRALASRPHDRAAILRTVPSYVGEKAVPMLLRALKDEDPTVRLAAVQTLVWAGEKSAVPSVTEALGDPDPKVRQAAVLALGKVGDASALQMLAEVATSVDEPMREAARRSLTRLGGDGVEQAMLKRACDTGESPEVRQEMLRALADRGAASAAPSLTALAKDKHAQVRAAAFGALETLAGRAELPALIELVAAAATAEDQSAAAKALAAAALRAGKPAEELARLAAAYDKASAPAKPGLLKAMGLIGWPAGLERARAALKDKDAAVSAAALEALAGWPDASPMEELLAAAQAEGASAERKALALQGYIRMVGLKQAEGLAPAEAVKLYETALDLADGEKEQTLALQGLGRTGDVRTLEFLEQYMEELAALEEEKLLARAEEAYVEVAKLLRHSHPQKARAALERICGASKNKELVERARQIIQVIK